MRRVRALWWATYINTRHTICQIVGYSTTTWTFINPPNPYDVIHVETGHSFTLCDRCGRRL